MAKNSGEKKYTYPNLRELLTEEIKASD